MKDGRETEMLKRLGIDNLGIYVDYIIKRVNTSPEGQPTSDIELVKADLNRDIKALNDYSMGTQIPVAISMKLINLNATYKNSVYFVE